MNEIKLKDYKRLIEIENFDIIEAQIITELTTNLNFKDLSELSQCNIAAIAYQMYHELEGKLPLTYIIWAVADRLDEKEVVLNELRNINAFNSKRNVYDINYNDSKGYQKSRGRQSR